MYGSQQRPSQLQLPDYAARSNKSNSALPPEHFTVAGPYHLVTVSFDGYGERINYADAIHRALARALDDASRQPAGGMMPRTEHRYTDNDHEDYRHVNFVLQAGCEMNWSQWYDAIGAIDAFYSLWDRVELSFSVLNSDIRKVGEGYLRHATR